MLRAPLARTARDLQLKPPSAQTLEWSEIHLEHWLHAAAEWRAHAAGTECHNLKPAELEQHETSLAGICSSARTAAVTNTREVNIHRTHELSDAYAAGPSQTVMEAPGYLLFA